MAISPLPLLIACFFPLNRLETPVRLKASGSSRLVRSSVKTGYRCSTFRVKADGGSGNEIKINSFRALLNRKDEELFQLKQKIEEEKIELCNLQERAKASIAIVERSIEETGLLHDSEDKLKGLKEVRIEFLADAETVEIAGSFNGWQNHIKMDPNPVSESLDSPDYREPLQWSVVLWLYPGVYQIKFVVDGTWRIDPRKEVSTSSNFANNIIRVDN